MLVKLQNSWICSYEDDSLIFESSVLNKTFAIRRVVNAREVCNYLNLLRNVSAVDEIKNTLALLCGDKFAHALIRKLYSDGVLFAPEYPSEFLNPDGCDDLFDRQTRFFSAFEKPSRSGWRINNDFVNSHVIVVGVGGYGSWLVALLARAGVRNITAIDHDVVEISNLPRQLIFSTNDVGQFKVDVIDKHLKINFPYVNFRGINSRIEDIEDLVDIFRNSDLTVNSLGIRKHMVTDHIARVAGESGSALLNADGPLVGPLTLPGITPCMECVRKELELKPHSATITQGPNPNFGPRLGINMSILAWEASCYLSGIVMPKTLDTIIGFNSFTYQTVTHKVQRDDQCPVCSRWEGSNENVIRRLEIYNQGKSEVSTF